MRGKVARLLRKQAELTGLPYRSLKRLWKSGAVVGKEKFKWRKVVEKQASESGSDPAIQTRLQGTSRLHSQDPEESGQGVLDRADRGDYGLPEIGR